MTDPDSSSASARPDAALPMGEGELRGWLRLLETPGIGRLGARKLLMAFGSPEAVFHAPPAARAMAVPAAAAQALAREPAHLGALLSTTLAWLAANPRHEVVALGDPRYPRQLYELADPPILLYASGDLSLLQGLSMAVVGSRHPSAQGIENARAFASALTQAGVTVVSGLALGIDAAAHEGALQAQAAGTIAVVGTGLDQIYPRQHRALTQRIAAEGLLLSEFALGTPPASSNFPQRNRIIAGLSRGTLVVEAAVQSGSLITARLAAEAGREVFAIPGSIHQPQSRGCHALIKQGAKLVECTEDILEELHGIRRPDPQALQPRAPMRRAHEPGHEPSQGRDVEQRAAVEVLEADDTVDDPVLRALGHDPASLEALQLRTGLSSTDLSVHLLTLELSGVVARLPGQRFQRIVRA